MRKLIASSLLVLVLTEATLAGPAAAAQSECTLDLSVLARTAYGDEVVLHVSGLTGIGGLDVYTRHGRMVEEMHLFLAPDLTELDIIYRWAPPELPPLPPLEPGHYVVHAVDAFECAARATFHVVAG